MHTIILLCAIFLSAIIKEIKAIKKNNNEMYISHKRHEIKYGSSWTCYFFDCTPTTKEECLPNSVGNFVLLIVDNVLR